MQFSVAGSNKRTRTIIGTALAQLGVEVTLGELAAGEGTTSAPSTRQPPLGIFGIPPAPGVSRMPAAPGGFPATREGGSPVPALRCDGQPRGKRRCVGSPFQQQARRSSQWRSDARWGGGILLVGSVTPRGLEAPVSAPCESGQPIDRHVIFPPTFRPAPPYLASCCPVALGRTEHATNPARRRTPVGIAIIRGTSDKPASALSATRRPSCDPSPNAMDGRRPARPQRVRGQGQGLVLDLMELPRYLQSETPKPFLIRRRR